MAYESNRKFPLSEASWNQYLVSDVIFPNSVNKFTNSGRYSPARFGGPDRRTFNEIIYPKKIKSY